MYLNIVVGVLKQPGGLKIMYEALFDATNLYFSITGRSTLLV